MIEQKFKRGNLVKVLVGHQIYTNGVDRDVSPEDVGRSAIIEYSYAEQYGRGDNNSYSIIWCDTGGSLAWKGVNELELIDEGGEQLFAEAKENREKVRKQNTDIKYISEHLDEGNLSSDSILMLFNLLSFETSFHSNGEYYILFRDWERFQPAFVHIKNAKSLDEAKGIFTPDGLLTLNVEMVYNAFH